MGKTLEFQAIEALRCFKNFMGCAYQNYDRNMNRDGWAHEAWEVNKGYVLRMGLEIANNIMAYIWVLSLTLALQYTKIPWFDIIV